MTGTRTPELLYATASGLVDAPAARWIGSLELTEALIPRIQDRDRGINAGVVRDFDRARETALTAGITPRELDSDIRGWMQDLTTIRFAGLWEREFGGFVPPPARSRA